MKTSFSIFTLIFFFAGVLFAQEYIPTPEDIQRFPSTKTMIVMETSPFSEYNLTMKKVVPAEWKITQYEFLEGKDFEANRKDNNLSFVYLVRAKFEKDKSTAQYLFMSLLLGGNVRNLSSMPDLCSMPIAHFEQDEDTYAYKLEVFVRFMQNHVRDLMERPKPPKNVIKYYNRNAQKMSGKTLYLLASDLGSDVNTEAKIKKFYSGPVKIVTQEEIEKAIKDKDPSVVFLHKVGPKKKNHAKSRVYKVLIGTGDAQLYHFDFHRINDKKPDAFLAADLKKLAKRNK